MSEDNDNDNNIKSSRGKVSEVDGTGEEFKLPRLIAPQSRGRLFNRKDSNKAPTYLPNINDEGGSEEMTFRKTVAVNITRSENDLTYPDTPAFQSHQLSVQDKLNIMMHPSSEQSNLLTNSNNFPLIPTNDDQLSDDLDFEQKILQNKQIIKMHRKIMNEPTIVMERKRQHIDERGSENRSKFGKHQTTNYERKMKQYHLSLENKYLQRKKQSLGIIPQRLPKHQPQPQHFLPFQKSKSKKTIPTNMQQTSSMIKQIRSNFGYGKFKNSAVTKSQSRQVQQYGSGNGKKNGQQQHTVLKSERGERQEQRHQKQQQQLTITKQSNKSQQSLVNQPKKTPRTSALFDNIQTFLQNPTAPDKHQKFYKQLFSKLKTKSLTQLEQKLKQINQKLSQTNENCDTKQTLQQFKQENNNNANNSNSNSSQILPIQNPIMQRTVRDWKRVDITSKTSLMCKQSDFEKQLDYISYLQERNSASLKKFVQQQKLMLELKFNRKLNKNSSPQNKQLIQSKAKVVVSQQYVQQAPEG